MIEVFTCNIEEIKDKHKIVFIEEIKDEIIVFRKDNIVNTFSSVCPHLAGQITLKKNSLQCKWHGLRFDSNGIVNNCSLKLKLRQYQNIIKDNKVYVKI